MTRELPPRLYLHGRSYRFRPRVGKPINLGRDLNEALRLYDAAVNRSPSTEPDPDAPLTMWRRHRKGARQRRIDFSLTIPDIAELIAKQKNRCAVTGLGFSAYKPGGLRIRPWIPSLDRLDNAKGYDVGNVRIVCAFVNVAMNGFGEKFFNLVLAPLIDIGVRAELERLDSLSRSQLGSDTQIGQIPSVDANREH